MTTCAHCGRPLDAEPIRIVAGEEELALCSWSCVAKLAAGREVVELQVRRFSRGDVTFESR
jgi:hypothetical protein